MINAEQFAKAGEKYLGRPYDRKQPGGMDCQDFYEQCARDCGLNMDLSGCNAWYRKFIQTGWTGSPEECKKVFGRIPKGATLFIHAFDGGEEERGYHDGLGNASHIGIKTGTGEGAIHSSFSRGCVAESKFADKTIQNGGWNMVGLSSLFDYGEDINSKLQGGGGDEPGPEPEPEPTPAEVWAIVTGPNGERVNTRKGPGTDYGQSKAGKLDSGERVQIIGTQGDWSKIICTPGGVKWVCWMKSEFLTAEDPADMDPGDGFPDDQAEDQDDPWDDGGDAPGDYVIIRIPAEDAMHLYSFLDLMKNQIIEQTGRG